MKKNIWLLIILVSCQYLVAQSTDNISYQAVVFDLNNNVVANQGIGMQISILQGEAYDSVVYTETQSPTTTSNGLVSIAIGSGVSADNFSAIDWSKGPYYIKTETDPSQEGGTNYTISGISQLMSVPYALYAEKSKSSSVPIYTNDEIASLSPAPGDAIYNSSEHLYQIIIVLGLMHKNSFQVVLM